MTLTTSRLARYTKPFTHTLALLDTVIHEVGHTVATLPFGTTLSIRIDADGGGVTHGSLGFADNFLTSFPIRVINLLAGYAAPVLLGLFLVLAGFAPSVDLSGWWLFALPLFLLAALLITSHMNTVSVFVLLAGWVAVVLAFTNTRSPMGSTVITGVDLAGWVLTFIGVVVLLSIRSLFTLLITVLWFAVVGVVFLTPWNITPALVVTLGVLFLLMGVWTIIKVAGSLMDADPNSPSDFDLLQEEFGGHPVGWFILFTLFLTGMSALMLFLLL